MPIGIFLLIHDEVRGPQIKSSYYKSPIAVPQEFVSKLYMSHAGFKSSSHMEIKLSRYRSISCFTGNLDRRTHKEGILGVLFEEGENYENLDLFLQRNLYRAIENPNDQMMESIFSFKLHNYLNLLDFHEKVEIDGIQDIFIITGNEVFTTCLLRIGLNQVTNSEMIEVYQNIIKKKETPLYYHIKLDLQSKDNTFLIIKTVKPNSNIEKILKSIKPYLDMYYYYTLEILTLFLFPSLVKMKLSKTEIIKDVKDEKNTVLQYLKNSENYSKDFNNFITHLIEGSYFLSPDL